MPVPESSRSKIFPMPLPMIPEHGNIPFIAKIFFAGIMPIITMLYKTLFQDLALFRPDPSRSLVVCLNGSHVLSFALPAPFSFEVGRSGWVPSIKPLLEALKGLLGLPSFGDSGEEKGIQEVSPDPFERQQSDSPCRGAGTFL